MEKNIKNNYSSAIQQFLKALFKFAVEHEYLDRNPFIGEFIKNNVEYVKQEYEIWTPEDFNQFINYVDVITYEALFMTLYVWFA